RRADPVRAVAGAGGAADAGTDRGRGPRPAQGLSMADVLFPRLSEAEPDGDQVASGQLLAEVMVEKVSGEVLAPADGLVRLLVGEDQTARQGEVIARV